MSHRVAFVSPIPEFDMIVKGDVLKVHTTIDPFTGSSVTYREPIALEYIDGIMRQHGYETRLFTETHMTADQVMREIAEYRPDVVGVSVHSAVVYPDTVEIARRIKETNPRLPVVLGGYHPTGEIMEYSRGNLDRTLLHSEDIDFVVVGEGENTFLELTEKLLGNGDVRDVKGIAFKDGSDIVITPRRPRVDFAKIPWPTRYADVIKSARCAPLAYPAPHSQEAAAQISGSRGCVYNCDFCSSMTIWPVETRSQFGRLKGEPVLYQRSAEDIVAEMRYLREVFGVNFFTFTDLTFNYNSDFVRDLCDCMIRSGVTHPPTKEDEVGWFAYATVDKTVKNPEIVALMAKAGCSRIGIGLESLDSAILAEHKPNNTFDNELKALQIVDSNGILNRSYMIVGWPNETPEMFDKARELLLSGDLPIDQLRLAFVVPFLGTPLYKTYKDRLLTHDWRKYTGDEPVVRNDHMSPEEMKSRVKDMLASYYASKAYEKHVKQKVRRFPHLEETFGYWHEYLEKRGII